MKKYDLNSLIVLDALLDEGSVSLAAIRLGLTQPTVSGALKKLRAQFDDPLFTRTSTGIVPTPRAEKLGVEIKEILRRAATVFEPEAFSPRDIVDTVTIAANDLMHSTIAVPFSKALRIQAPGIKVALIPAEIRQLHSKLLSGEIDLAVTTPRFAHPDLHQRELRYNSYVCVVRKEHPIKAKRATLRQYLSYNHVLISPTGGSFSGPADQALAAHKQQRNVTISVPNFLILPDLLETDNLIALVPERLAKTWTDRLRVFAPPIEVQGFSTIVVWHPRVHHDAKHRWMRNLLVQTTKAE
ncbi:MAG: LysR family transcriptional regulator [Rhodobiaceae bacterium]|nr:LysR family transcriptional regulator [Rhodobiaceae bacterium]